MHRTLLVCELLTIIFHHLEELDLRTLPPSSKAGLARCARTCKAWKGPALKIIWEILDSPLPLMKLFPLDAFSNGGRKGPEVWRYRRTLRPRDWVAFAEYAPLVRHLTFKEGKDVSTSALIALDVQRPSKYRSSPLLSNLVSLKWTVELSNTLTLCSTFVSPSLKRLAIHAVGITASAAERSDATGGLLCTITDLAPGLTELELVVDRLWAVSDIVNPINALSRLKVLTLDVGSICPFILRGLPIHPMLTKLEINLCGIDEAVFEKLAAHRPRPGEFVALEELSITADMHIINSTLSLIIHTPLTRLSISTFSLITAEQLRNCLSHLSTTSPALQKLTITTSFVGEFEPMFKILDQNSESYRVDPADLLPLVNLKRLEDLSIQVGYPLLLDDADIVMIVSALPVLRNLSLSPALEWAPSNWRPNLSMACLEWISAKAPSIKSLGITIDAHKTSSSADQASQGQMQAQINPQGQTESPPTPPLTPDPSFVLHSNGGESNAGTAKIWPRSGRPSRLETLFLGSSVITESDEEKVRESLQRLFPFLVMVRTSAAAPQTCSNTEASRRLEIWERIADAIASKKKRAGSEVYERTSQRSKGVEMMTDQDIEMEIWNGQDVDDCEYERNLAVPLGK